MTLGHKESKLSEVSAKFPIYVREMAVVFMLTVKMVTGWELSP